MVVIRRIRGMTVASAGGSDGRGGASGIAAEVAVASALRAAIVTVFEPGVDTLA